MSARRHVLGALTLVVLGAHIALLRPVLPEHRPPARTPPVTLRTIVLEPAAMPAQTPQAAALRHASARDTLPRAAQPVSRSPAAGAGPQPLPDAETYATAPAAPAPPTAPAAAFSLPAPARLTFESTGSSRSREWRGQAELQWHADAAGYEARLHIQSPIAAARTQHSTGEVGAHGLAPLRFASRNRSEEAVHFERDKARVTFSANRPQAALQPGAQDRLSVLFQLAGLAAARPALFVPGHRITLQTAGTRDASESTFTVETQEVLLLPGGRQDTVKLTRAPRWEYDEKVEVWLAPGADYLPVRLRLTQPNGDWADHQWSRTDRG